MVAIFNVQRGTRGGNVADKKNGSSNENKVVADVLDGDHQSGDDSLT
jgi:hypothetical protein